MENKFIEIISSPMMNTTSIQRYSGTKLAEPESLSTHIVECQMMGYMMITHMNKFCEEKLDRSKYLELAFHHDLEESVTGDVVRTLKYHNPSVLKELQKVASDVAEEMYLTYFKDTDGECYDIWSSAKVGKEGYILKLVDTLTVVNKVIKEILFLHNYNFLRVAYEVQIYLSDLIKDINNHSEQFTESAIRYIKEILGSANHILYDILQEYQEFSSKYNIYNKSLLKSRS